MKTKSRKIFSLFLAVLLLVSAIPMGTVTAFAYESGDFEYGIISEEEKTCGIIKYFGNAYELTIPSQIDGYTVTAIEREAFCSCSSLGIIEIPDSVTSIGRYAFYYCTSLISIIIPDSVISIGDHVFEQTPYYRSESYWENGVLYIGNHLIGTDNSLSGAYTVKPGTKTIADGALSYCTELTSVEFPDSVTDIGYYVLEGCTSLTSVIIPDSVTRIYDYTLADCPSVTVYGYSDSCAQTYAERMSIPFVALAEPSIVQYDKAQIRFRGIKDETSTKADYKGTFDVRTVAKISQEDFINTFGNEENALENITDIGFVYAAISKVTDFDIAAAKSVVRGGEAENYVKKSVNYIQHTGDGADYVFTCFISDIKDADKTDGVTCLGFICYGGKYYYFDTASTVSYNELYTTYMTA